ncbi:MAG TPA: STAS domain-containing protein [Nitrospirota bacterium]|nr:STAS domain-containing protein [Nitrospirota bacterium]
MKVEITSEMTGTGFLLRLKGDVDMSSSSDVRIALGEVFRQGGKGIRALFVDLSQVRYMDSSGIATLVEAMQTCMKLGARLRLIDLSPAVRDVFELARLASIFEIFPSVDEAIKGL